MLTNDYKPGDRVEIVGWSKEYDGPATVIGLNAFDEFVLRSDKRGICYFTSRYLKTLREGYVPTKVVVDPYSRWRAGYFYALSNSSGFDKTTENVVRGWAITNALLALASSVVWRTNPEHDVVTVEIPGSLVRRIKGFASMDQAKARKELLRIVEAL